MAYGLPTVGADEGTWGQKVNDSLEAVKAIADSALALAESGAIGVSYPQVVLVSTGEEARPDGSLVVLWLGGTTEPINMTANDVWFSGATVSIPTDTTPPTVPVGLASSSVTTTGFTLTWSGSSDDTAVTGYQVRVGTNTVASPTATTYTFVGLTAGTNYQVQVRAGDAAGNWSAWSAALSVTTTASSDTTAPTVPTGLASSAITPSSFTVSWTAATDDVAVTGYRVLRDGAIVATPSGTSASLTGLTASTTYSITVQARDAAGNWSSTSSPLSVTTSAPVATTHSVFGATSVSPHTSVATIAEPTVFNDGGGALIVANRFSAPSGGWTLQGARLWIPAGVSGAPSTITFYAWNATGYPDNGSGPSAWIPNSTATKVLTSWTAGQWNTVTFTTPVTITGTTGWVGYSWGGSHYVHAAVSVSTAIPAVDGSGYALTESGGSPNRGANNAGGGSAGFYGLDVVVA